MGFKERRIERETREAAARVELTAMIDAKRAEHGEKVQEGVDELRVLTPEELSIRAVRLYVEATTIDQRHWIDPRRDALLTQASFLIQLAGVQLALEQRAGIDGPQDQLPQDLDQLQ